MPVERIEVNKMNKGFLSLGTRDTLINIECIDQDKCYLDKRIGKVAVFDKFGNRFNVEPKLCKGKIRWRE